MDDDEAERTVTGTTWGEEQARGIGRDYVIHAANIDQCFNPNPRQALRWFTFAHPGRTKAEHKAFLAGFDAEMRHDS